MGKIFLPWMVGSLQGVALSTDFESGLEQADAVLFADGPIPLPEKYLLGKIAQALDAKKR